MRTVTMKTSSTSPKSALSRRRFLGTTAVTAAAISVVPSHVLGLRGATSPNEKLNIAGIGVGGRGSGDLHGCASENIVALCDVDWSRARGSFSRWPKAARYRDYRKLLDKEEKNIDAVIVATPDHLHAFASIASMKLGKHVYCEKPLTHSVWEARQMGIVSRETGVATQMGNQGQASEETRRLEEYVRAGAIGKVREAHIWTDRPSRGLNEVYWPQGVARPKEKPPVPESLDWDLWIGPAPYRPYHPAYVPFSWRGWWDFGTGALGDIGCHSFDPVFRALKLGQPLSVQASSSRVNEETYPLSSMVTYRFPARGNLPPCKLVWYDGGMRPPRPADLPDGEPMGDNGRLLVGDEGYMLGNKVYPESRRKDVGTAPKTLPRSIGHHQEWIEAAKGNAKKPGSNFQNWAGTLAEVVLLGNVALRLHIRELLTRKTLRWDPENLRFTNENEANEYLRRDYREGWRLA